MWKSVVKRNRCLIPMNGFYEWRKQSDGKQPYFIQLREKNIASFAGIWESWSHEGKAINTYSIMTTSPNKEMESIHDRMPVILHPYDENQWLNADTEEDIKALLEPYPDGQIITYEVDKKINSVYINDDTLIGSLNSL